MSREAVRDPAQNPRHAIRPYSFHASIFHKHKDDKNHASTSAVRARADKAPGSIGPLEGSCNVFHRDGRDDAGRKVRDGHNQGVNTRISAKHRLHSG
jgi:hypothetical protein